MTYAPRALRELEAKFLRIDSTDPQTMEYVDAIGDADGVIFLCPKCYDDNRGPVGTHSVICWSPKVGQEHVPRPGRWNLTGTGLDDLTLVAGSSSVALQGSDCQAHFFVRNGRIVPA